MSLFFLLINPSFLLFELVYNKLYIFIVVMVSSVLHNYDLFYLVKICCLN